MEERLICYLCDPEKNTECIKWCCVYNPNATERACYSTTEREYARLDFSGQPVENPDMNGETRKKVKTNFEEQTQIEMPAEDLDAEEIGIPGGGYKDPKWQGIAQEILKKTEEKGLPWFAGLFNQQLIDEIYRKNEGTEGETER